MRQRPAADKQMPPWPNAKVELASYTVVPGHPAESQPDADDGGWWSPASKERDRLLYKMRIARAHIEQVITSLIKDSHGEPREPSLNECEARETIELLQQIHEELAP